MNANGTDITTIRTQDQREEDHNRAIAALEAGMTIRVHIFARKPWTGTVLGVEESPFGPAAILKGKRGGIAEITSLASRQVLITGARSRNPQHLLIKEIEIL